MSDPLIGRRDTDTQAAVILVVDDDEVIRLLLRQFLEGEGYQVVEAVDGNAAIEKVARSHFDLVIMDIAMPGLDGNMVCENIRSSSSDSPPVLMVTALDDEETVDRSFQAGAVDYVRKPIHWSVLKNRIRYIISASRATRKLDKMRRNYELILHAAANGICQIDANLNVNFINPAGLRLLGYKESEVIGRDYKEFFELSMPGSSPLDLDTMLLGDEQGVAGTFHYEQLRMLRKDGTSFPVDFHASPIIDKKKSGGWVIQFQDITEKEEAAELIRHMANHDSLTNLPNRNYFRKRLPQAISLAKRHDRILCLLFIDLDRFKPINDTFGHNVGDLVLQVVAQRLTAMLRSSDSVCRLGGDEFVILLESTNDSIGAENVAAKAIEVLNEPIEVENHVCYIGASIGISIYPEDCEDAETMLRQADIAMYHAKKKGRNCYSLYRDMAAEKKNSIIPE